MFLVHFRFLQSGFVCNCLDLVKFLLVSGLVWVFLNVTIWRVFVRGKI